VLYRLGVSTAPTEKAALEASRKMNSEFPGIIDAALWHLGREFCSASNPDCASCPLRHLCAKRID
jgi:endonuclease III